TDRRARASASSSRRDNFENPLSRLEIGCSGCRNYDRGEHINQLTKEKQFGYGYDERIAGGRCSLRPPGAPLESDNEGIHFWRAERHIHYRSAKNAEDVSRCASVCVQHGS